MPKASNLKGYRLPAEWDGRYNSVLLSYPAPHTDWAPILEEARKCFDEIIKAISTECGMRVVVIGDVDYIESRFEKKGIPLENISIVNVPYNDTWARDFGPLTLVDENNNIAYTDFKFNGWGLKFPADKDNLIVSNLACEMVLGADANVLNYQDFVLEGGSVESDGCGTILTTEHCLLSPNRNGSMSVSEIEECLTERLGVNRVLMLSHGDLEGDDTDSHIDTLARFVDSETIACVVCDDISDPHSECLEKMWRQLSTLSNSKGRSYRLLKLPLPAPICDECGKRLPATYANFLITPRVVLVPTYNQPLNDELALGVLRSAFPDKNVIGIDCRALIKQHGSLHCVTMQMILP